MYRIAIVEDENAYAEQLQRYFDTYAAETGTAIETIRFTNGMAIAEDYKPIYDLILLDIEMPMMDGMRAAERIRTCDSDVLLIFITNLAQYAIRGYSVSALDYVLKPISYQAFYLKLSKALSILKNRDTKSIILNVEGEVVKLPLADILYVEVVNHQLFYHTEQKTYHIYQSLKEADAQFGSGFARCNHCYLVNLRHVKGVKDECVLLGKERLKISRPKKKEFMQRLSDYYRFGG